MGKRAFFWDLAKDPTANVIVISAAALVPLVAMVGGAVDASRYYMTSTRLQAACDAGALAARRAMEVPDDFDEVPEGGGDTPKQIGERFFDQNYEDGMFGLDNLSRSYTSDGGGKVLGQASGELPTGLMHIFGYGDFDLSVECSAEVNISNTDVMFVLDVTGSMNCAPDNPNGGSCNNTEASNAKIKGMREAVMSFYDTVDESTSETAQVRYGVVPYASNVNVGGSLRPEWMAPTHTFQTRVANYEQTFDWEFVSATIVSITETSRDSDRSGRNREQVFGLTEAECDALKPANYLEFDDSLGRFNQQGPAVVNGTTRTTRYNDTNEDILVFRGFANHRSSDGRCRYGHNIYEGRGDAVWDEVEELVEEVNFQNWTYRELDTSDLSDLPETFGRPSWADVNLSSLYTDENRQIDLPIGSNGALTTVSWDGCIEEASTEATGDFSDVNDDFNDLDFSLVPDEPGEYWAPLLYGATWKRENSDGNVIGTLTQTWNESRPSYSCPAPAFNLTEIENTSTESTDGKVRTRKDLQNYVDSLRGRSNTYHDIGMIWGARFIAPQGIFRTENESAPNGDAIARHIVFMTDGLLAPNTEVYGTYGIEWWSRRISGDGNWTRTRDRHAERFQVACRAAQNENITVWVVAFGTTLTANLRDCASPGRAFQANDSTQLKARFKEIAQTIAALRLTS